MELHQNGSSSFALTTLKKAQAWYNSPEHKKVNEIRTKSTKSRTFIVEGM
jgi:uncharacterized protein (DUF1330 family)